MTDAGFLRQYWARADKQEEIFLRRVRRLHPEDAVQAAVDRFGLPEGSARLDVWELNRLHRNIEEWDERGMLSGEFGLRARDAAHRKRITSDDAFLLYLMAAWAEYYTKVEQYALEMFVAATGQPETTVVRKVQAPSPTTPLPLHDALAVDGAYRARQVHKLAVSQRQQEVQPTVTQPQIARVFAQQERWLLTESNSTSDATQNPPGHHGYLDREMAELLSYFAIETYRREGVREVRFVAVIDEKTTPNCRRLHGQVFRIDDLKPGINAPPIADPPHACRSVLKPLKPLPNTPESGIIKTDKQFGKKIGKHAIDYGLDPANAADREKMAAIIDEIVQHCDECRAGEWRGQEGEVIFYIKGEDVVVAKQDRTFITILKGGVSNERVKNARRL